MESVESMVRTRHLPDWNRFPASLLGPLQQKPAGCFPDPLAVTLPYSLCQPVPAAQAHYRFRPMLVMTMGYVRLPSKHQL